MEDIMKEMRTHKAKIKRISGEGNPIADYLANLAINQTDIQEFNEFAELPIADKHIINMDKTQISSIRIRTGKLDSMKIQLQTYRQTRKGSIKTIYIEVFLLKGIITNHKIKFFLIYVSTQKLSKKGYIVICNIQA
ncbi:hypothetical protein R3W88_011908 [Solanum pinnatisectum]|uniref:Uncharacterized protein n=1 Tax=Solanum pinnatisectum TaxID=50273 RepID=A0AAV9L7G1_9SOLN|nr:hypothetical protein R3W88_011908 [Solanum pinnatisectum]